MSDKLREEFEQYCHKEDLGMTGSDCTGEYYNPVIEMLWHCWKSSRAKDKDAARYRWLRDCHWSESSLCVVAEPKSAVILGSNCPSRELLDAAIDEAIQCK